MNWFTALANAAAYYFRARAITASYDLQQRIEHDIHEAEQEIEALRQAGDPDSQRAADRVRARLMRARGIHASITFPDVPLAPASRIEAAEGGDDPDR